MDAKYGFSQSSWENAKSEMREILVETAKAGGTLPYSVVVSRTKTIKLEPNAYALAHMLGEISTEEDEAGRGMLSVVVVHKHGDMKPGPGFFELAKRLGRDTSDITKCWIEELKKVHACWKGVR
ncbi:MAG: hypothetical protein V3S55_04050 [Nitrospiraceae bacterium]